MEPEHLARLRKTRVSLVRELVAEDVLDYLDQEGVLDLDDRERIMSEVTTRDKAGKLIDILVTREDFSYKVFVDSLRDCYPHLVDELHAAVITGDDLQTGCETLDETGKDAEILNEIRQELSLRYEEMFTRTDPIPWSEEFVLSLGDVYTELGISQKDTFNRQFIPHVTEDLLFTSNIVPTGSGVPRRVFIDGVAGIGKTTLCQKMAYDWTIQREESSVKTFKVVFLIQLSLIVDSQSLGQLIWEQLFPKDFKFSMEEVIGYVRRHQVNVLIIFDGLATSNARSHKIVTEYLQGKVLHQTYGLVTSRPMTLSWKYFDVRLRCSGFTLSSALKYVSKFFKGRDQSYYSQLIHRIQDHSVIQQLCQNPFNVLLLCLLWEDNQGMLPRSLTQLFKDIIDAATQRYCIKYGLAAPGSDSSQLCQSILTEVMDIAFKGIMESRSEYTMDEMTNLAGDKLYLSAMITTVPPKSLLRPRSTFAFTHRNIQEILAAMYCVQLGQDELMTHFRGFLQHRHTRIICIFIIGLLKDEPTRLEKLFEILTELNSSEESIVIKTNQGCHHQSESISYNFNKTMRVYSTSFHALNEVDQSKSCIEIIARKMPRDMFLDIKSFQNHFCCHDFRASCFSVLEHMPSPRAVMLMELTVFSSENPEKVCKIVLDTLSHVSRHSEEKFQLFIYCDGLNRLGFATMAFLLNTFCKLNAEDDSELKFLKRKVRSINFLNHCCTMIRVMTEDDMNKELKVVHPGSKHLPQIVIYKNVLPCPSKNLPALYNSEPMIAEANDCCVKKEGDLAAEVFKRVNPHLGVDIRTAEIPADFILDVY